MKRLLSAFAVLAFISSASLAFSPYENHLLTAKTKRAAIIACVKAGQEADVDDSLEGLLDKRAARSLKKKDITNLSCYRKKLGGKTWVMIYFDYEGDDYLQAVKDFEASGDVVEALNKSVTPHPRAERYGNTWLQMEWICYIRGALGDKETRNALSMVTTIKPEKEKEYRLLHQSVWPGVADQMARGSNRHFSIFLVEIDKTIYEFFYLEYIGTDPDKDTEMNNNDPFNIRWWKLTDPCQTPLPGSKDIWSMMDKVKQQKEQP